MILDIMELSNNEILEIYNNSKNKHELSIKLNIPKNQNTNNTNKYLLFYLSKIGLTLDDIKGKAITKHYNLIQKEKYNLNPNYCEYCGKPLSFEKRNSKCCNQSCANSLGNIKKGKRSIETKQKISKSFKNGIKNHKYILKNQYGEYNYGLRKCICEYCGKEFESNKNQRFCSKECSNKSKSLKLSLLMKEKSKKGLLNGWLSRNIISYAENFWKKILDNNNIQYIREYHFNKKYFLDFYIEINNRKIDLEIDGSQHNFIDRHQHDLERDNYITSNGLEVYRILWNEINSNKGKKKMEEKINLFFQFLGVTGNR